MIKVKLEKTKRNNIKFKLGIKPKDVENFKFLKRALMEGKVIKGNYNYEIPLKFFYPILNNLSKDKILLDKNTEISFLEFWDDYEEKHYSILEATPQFMRAWRSEGCPNIFKIVISKDTLEIKKEIAFKKLNIKL